MTLNILTLGYAPKHFGEVAEQVLSLQAFKDIHRVVVRTGDTKCHSLQRLCKRDKRYMHMPHVCLAVRIAGDDVKHPWPSGLMLTLNIMQ